MTLQESYKKFVNKELQRDQFKNILNRSQFNNKLFTPSNSIEDSVKILLNRGVLTECRCEDVTEGWQEKMPEDYDDDLKAAGLGEVRDDFDTLDRDTEEDYYTDNSGGRLHPDDHLDRDMGKKTYQGIDVDTLYAAAKAELPYVRDPKEAFETALANLKIDKNYYDDPNWMNRSDDNIDEIDASLGGFAADAALVGGALGAILIKLGIDKFNEWRQKPLNQKKSDLESAIKSGTVKDGKISHLLNAAEKLSIQKLYNRSATPEEKQAAAQQTNKIYDATAKQLVTIARDAPEYGMNERINEAVDSALNKFRKQK